MSEQNDELVAAVGQWLDNWLFTRHGVISSMRGAESAPELVALVDRALSDERARTERALLVLVASSYDYGERVLDRADEDWSVDHLFAEGLLRNQSDITGEVETLATDTGTDAVVEATRAALRRLGPSDEGPGSVVESSGAKPLDQPEDGVS